MKNKVNVQNNIVATLSSGHVMFSLKEKVYRLYLKNEINWNTVSLPGF